VEELYELFDTDTHYLGRLTNLKQFGIVKNLGLSLNTWISEQRACLMPSSKNFLINGLKDEIQS
jgi:hypothetical protein